MNKEAMIYRPGKIVIISSPSGGGKTSICQKLLSTSRKNQGWKFSISYTTRKRRAGERNGREYFFVNEAEFKRKVEANFFTEHFKVHLYRYGTPRKAVDDVIKKGGVMILDVDVQGAKKLKKIYPKAMTIFILPPSKTELKKRLIQRGTETKEQLKVRFENAKKEIEEYKNFNYVVINQELKAAVSDVLAIIASHGLRIENIVAEQFRKILV